MESIKVESSHVKSVRYDKEKRVLLVDYGKGEWEYAGVGVQLWEGLKKAESVGSFLHEHIKGKYRHRKVGG